MPGGATASPAGSGTSVPGLANALGTFF